MFVTGPDVVKTVTNEVVTQEELGGAITHTTKSGVADVAFENDIDALLATRDFFDFLPLSNRHDLPERPCARSLGPDRGQPRHADPGQRRQALRHARADPEDRSTRATSSRSSPPMPPTSSPASAGSRAARSASSPTSRWCWPACSTSTRSKKAARFVRFCDAFDIPILTFVDVPGFLPGVAQEHNGIIKNGAKLLFAYAEATVPKITVITRKAYGGAYDVMASKHLRGDLNYAWPTAEIAVMGAKGAVEIIFRKDIGDPEKIAERTAEYEARFANPFVAASQGLHRRGDHAAFDAAADRARASGSCATSSSKIRGRSMTIFRSESHRHAIRPARRGRFRFSLDGSQISLCRSHRRPSLRQVTRSNELAVTGAIQRRAAQRLRDAWR